jgi:predicted ATPase
MISNQFLTHISLLREKIPSFAQYPFDLPFLTDLDRIELHPNVTFLVGENGSGKSTLLEAIAIALGFNAEGGGKNFRFSTKSSHSVLHNYLRIAKGIRRPRTSYFLRAESFFNVCSEIERLDEEPSFDAPILNAYGSRSLHEQSHGEAFLALINKRFSNDGLYLLDEPEAALSPQRQLSVLSRMNDLVCNGSQFIIATHSPILMAYPNSKIYEFSSNGIRNIGYDEVEHVQIMRSFLNNPERMLSVLMSD